MEDLIRILRPEGNFHLTFMTQTLKQIFQRNLQPLLTQNQTLPEHKSHRPLPQHNHFAPYRPSHGSRKHHLRTTHMLISHALALTLAYERSMREAHAHLSGLFACPDVWVLWRGHVGVCKGKRKGG